MRHASGTSVSGNAVPTAAASAVATAERSYQISVAQLGAGIIDLQTVLNTQTALYQAETLLAQVRLTRIQAIVTLFQALGGGWELPSS